MTFLSALLALAWDRFSALHRPSQFERLFGVYADWIVTRFNAGTPAHGWLAWAAAALLPSLPIGMIGLALHDVASLLGMVWAAAALYYCVGFQRIGEAARLLAEDMPGGDPPRIRDRLAGLADAVGRRVMGSATEQAGAAEPASTTEPAGATDPTEPAPVDPAELARESIVLIFSGSLERLFGVLFWFVLFGPFGAVVYALSRLLDARWRDDSDFHATLARVVETLDWLPSRLLAFSFAIVGNFDDAMLGWRTRVGDDAARNEAVVRAAGFGALGLNDIAPGPEYVSGAVGLIMRALLLWLGVLGLFWLGGL